MSSKGTFNLYLTDTEHAAVTDMANILGTSRAYVVRLIFRKFFDLPVGGKGEAELAHLADCGLIRGDFPHVGNLTDAG
jgi:hypothetical protein